MNKTVRQIVTVIVTVFGSSWYPFIEIWAHEHEHTHAGLTRVIFEYLEAYWDREGLNPNQRPTLSDIAQARQGSIDEDDCPLYYSHFYNPNTPTLAGSNVTPGDFIDRNCSWTDNPDNVGKPGAKQFFKQQLATNRAAELWNCALQVYRGSSCTEPTLMRVHPAGRAEAFHLLGRVLHLLEDMTSPAHLHFDPHGKPGLQGFGDCKGQDADDFENWGWCISRGSSTTPDADHGHIRDYLTNNGQMTARMKQRMVDNLSKLYLGEPQGVSGSLDPVPVSSGNLAKDFLKHVAELVYDFTTFKVKLIDPTNFTDVQPESELRRMLRGSINNDNVKNCGAFTIDTGLCDVAGGWTISGDLQEVGFSDGLCGRSEAGLDTNEEWWPMEDGDMGACTENSQGGINGFAYIENAGGEGPAGFVDPDSFIPLRYGCQPGKESICGGARRSKRLYRKLYGVNHNNARRTQLRIYGDVLYPTAVAYGAGLVQTFIEEVNRPTAVAGGPYFGEECQPINFDASGSSDQDNGVIVAYDWDFKADGMFDQTTVVPFTQHAYFKPFIGQLIVQVTDNDGFTDDDEAVVIVTPDMTPPNLANMTVTPNLLWPPNHKMQRVHVDPMADDACGIATCQIVLVASNESSNSVGDGNTSPEMEITGDLTLKLRAERSGSGNGRVYTTTVQCTDVNGNSSQGSADVTVPHSKSKNLATKKSGKKR